MTELRNYAGEIPTLEEEKVADELRAQAFRLANEHPIASAHLSLAAANIAPTSKFEAAVAFHVVYEVMEFTNALVSLHHQALRDRKPEGRFTIDGIRKEHLEPSWAYLFEDA